jgi:hypothetical protein
MSIPTLIALAKQHNIKANRNRKNNIPYVRVMATFSQMASLLDSQNLSYEQVSVADYPVTDAARFRDGIFKVLYTSGDVIMKVNPEGVVQKNLAPNNLKIENKVYSDSVILKQDIIAGLNSCGANAETVVSCINILNAIENDTNITLTNTLCNSTDKSKITSDFGEVALAFNRIVKQGGTILFPAASNQSDFDFYHNNVPISAKGDKGSSRYLVGNNKEIANHIDTLGDSNIERMFKAWYKRDMLAVFEYAAPDCPEINWWNTKLQGFTESSIAAFTQNHTWDEFVESIKESQNGGLLGIPKKNRSTYEAGDTNPLVFALLTIWARYYNVHNSKKFNSIACKMLKNSKSKIVFEFFNYNNAGEVLITNQAITTYSKWDIRYHGNANRSLNNYPALEGLK